MEKAILALDLGTSFLKTVTFSLEQKGVRILSFGKTSYDSKSIKSLEKKIKEILSSKKREYKINQAIIGSGEGVGKGGINKDIFFRKSYSSPISKSELGEFIKNSQKKSFFQKAEELNNESFFLVSAKIKNIVIDGRLTFSPIGKTGRKIYLEIVNFYLPLKIYQSLKKILSSLNIENYSFEYIPSLLPNILFEYTDGRGPLTRKIGSKVKFFIDIGGKSTQMSVLEDGEINKVIEVSFGGDYFIKRILEKLKIKLDQLSLIDNRDITEFRIRKSSISSDNRKRIIQNIFERGNKIWTEKMLLILNDYKKKDRPFEIYLFGGGSDFISLEKSQKEFARESFHCIIKRVSPLDLKHVFNFDSKDSQATIPLLLCKNLVKS